MEGLPLALFGGKTTSVLTPAAFDDAHVVEASRTVLAKQLDASPLGDAVDAAMDLLAQSAGTRGPRVRADNLVDRIGRRAQAVGDVALGPQLGALHILLRCGAGHLFGGSQRRDAAAQHQQGQHHRRHRFSSVSRAASLTGRQAHALAQARAQAQAHT